MKTFLVPVDFSETSVNAAKYAVNLVSAIPDVHVILYHVYNKISLSALTEKDDNTRQKISEDELDDLVKILAAPDSVKLSTVTEEGFFVSALETFVLSNKVDMVIMGITGSSRIKQVFMGTNTLNVTRHVHVPVMIIPPDAVMSSFKNVLLISDFKDVARTTPFAAIKTVLDLFPANLHIVNVDSEHYIELTEEFKLERQCMDDKLSSYNPEYSFLRAFDFLEGINRFAANKSIDAIITIPHKHGILSQLFKTSHTKKLAYHSHVPIIAIPA